MTNPMKCVALGFCLLWCLAASAVDLGRMLQNLDVNKVTEIGRKLNESTTEMSPPQEIALGRDLAARILGTAPLLNDPEVQTYVNKVGRWLTLHTERPDLPWHFAVAATDIIGAFATPGGNVIITAGLLRLMRDENELAGVLAHEISHVVHKHHVQAIMKRARAGLARDIAATFAEQYVAKNPLVSQLVLDTGMNLYASGLDQQDEFDADRNGIVIAARAGYDPLGLVYMLSTLDAIDAQEPRATLMFATHPPTRARLEQLANISEQITVAGSLKDSARFAQIQARLAR